MGGTVYFPLANINVPQVSAMSSTMMAVLPFTSPTNTMLSTSFAFLRCMYVCVYVCVCVRVHVRVCKVGVCCSYYYLREGRKQKSNTVHTSLWMRANPIFKLSAMEVTLRGKEQTSCRFIHIDSRYSRLQVPL